jgi:hypothetical protein
VPASFFRAQTALRGPDGRPISDQARMMLGILESYCRMKAFCWVSNKELCFVRGCAPTALRQAMRELEAADIIYRSRSDSQKDVRLGIILRKRADLSRPVASTDELLRSAIDGLEEERASAKQGRKPGSGKTLPNRPARTRVSTGKTPPVGSGKTPPVGSGKTPPVGSGKTPPVGSGKTPPELIRIVVVKKDEVKKENSRGEETPSLSLPTTTTQTTDAEPGRPTEATGPPVEVPEATADPAAENDPPGLAQHLQRFDPELQAAFGTLGPGARAKITSGLKLVGAEDPVLAAETRSILQAARRSIALAPPLPATTAELLEQLPGASVERIATAAEALKRDFGTDKDRRMWPAFRNLCEAVWRGDVPAEKVADAYSQAMGRAAKNKGAVFCRALRDHGITFKGPEVLYRDAG